MRIKEERERERITDKDGGVVERKSLNRWQGWEGRGEWVNSMEGRGSRLGLDRWQGREECAWGGKE